MRVTGEPNAGDIAIPNWLAPDVLPASPSQWDEEFDATLGAWKVGTGGPVTVRDSHLRMPTSTAVYRTGVPPIPFEVVAKCAAVNFDNLHTTTANASLGLGVADPTAGASFSLELDIGIVDNTSFFGAHWTNLVFDNNIGTELRHVGYAIAVPHWQKLVVNSTTSVDGWFSMDGIFWTYQELSAYNPSLTIGSVTLMSYGCQTAWDYVRFKRL